MAAARHRFSSAEELALQLSEANHTAAKVRRAFSRRSHLGSRRAEPDACISVAERTVEGRDDFASKVMEMKPERCGGMVFY
jgi:hypothetical protein